MLEDVSNPFSILFACFLAANRFDVLRVSEDNSAGSFQNVVNRFPADSMHTSLQLFSASHAAQRRNLPVQVENRLLL